RHRLDCSLAPTSQSIALGSAASFQSREICNRTPTVHLHSVRSGSAHLHWRGLCNDGSDFDSGNGRSALSTASQGRPPHRTPRSHHLAAAARTADDRGATTTLTATVSGLEGPSRFLVVSSHCGMSAVPLLIIIAVTEVAYFIKDVAHARHLVFFTFCQPRSWRCSTAACYR